MYKFPIGIMTTNLRMERFSAARAVAEIGGQGIQIGCSGELDPDNLTVADRKEYARFVKDLGMEISAICGDIGGFKFAEGQAERIEKSCRILDMAADMGVKVVTSHIGAVPAAPAHPRYGLIRDAVAQVAEYAQKVGVYYAIETGPETGWVLRGFIEDIGIDALRVNLDPANIAMVTGENPAVSVRTLGNLIVHTHAKDGRLNHFVEADIIYGCKEDPAHTKLGCFTETPLGEGHVNWPEYLQALTDIGYKGFLTIEREVGEDRIGEVTRSYNFLKGLVG